MQFSMVNKQSLKKRLVLYSVFKFLCILLFLLVVFYLYKSGIVADEYTRSYDSNTNFSSNYLWFSFFSLLTIIILMKCLKSALNKTDILYDVFYGKYKFLLRFFDLIILFTIVGSTFSVIHANLKLNNIINLYPPSKIIQKDAFTEITLDQLNEFMDTQNTGIIYIKRDDCYVCNQVEPDLKTFSNHNKVHIFYYDTVNDRETNQEYLINTLDKYEVNSVQFLMIIKNGKIIKTFEGELMVDELKEYLSK